MRAKIENLRDHYILCGFGRVGEEIARDFVDRGMPFVIVETNPEAIARAQGGLPHKPIRIVVGYPASGGADSPVSIIAGALQSELSRNISVDYKPGDSGMAVGEYLKTATPDGSVIAFMTSVMLAGKLTIPRFPFDPQTDLQPLTLAGTYATAFAVSPKIGVVTLAEYVEWLKAGGPERARFGTTAPGSFTQHFGTALGREIGVPLEAVPYRSAHALVADLEGGRIPAGTSALSALLTHHRGGRLKLLLTSAAKRRSTAPNVPTALELGFPNLQQTNGYAFFAPRGMPAALAEAWTAELRKSLESREVSQQLLQLGFQVETSTPAELAARLAADFESWREKLDLLGLKPVK
jgi:tripartite-type tricarboxylate transporter receptor subunit TctC